MRLYRMELYKLYHTKMFLVSSVLTVFITVFYFWAEGIGGETAVVNGEVYHGYAAVRVNRQIMEEYRGALTDEKVEAIVERYGLPTEVREREYHGWVDANCLSVFVTEYLSDGYIRYWNDYQAPTKVYAIADTELGRVQRVTGEEIGLAYTKGWEVLLESLQMGMQLASVVVLLAVSVVFAQEGQTRMLPLLSTTQEGRGKDVWAKIASAFTLTVLVYITMALLCFLMSFCVFGLDGGDCPLAVALTDKVFLLNANVAASYMPMASFAMIVLGMEFLAMLMQCGITMCVSAHCRSNFGAVSGAAALWGMPVLISMFFGGFGYFFTSCMPVFLMMTGSVYEAVMWGREVLMLPVIIGVIVGCVVEGVRGYKRV